MALRISKKRIQLDTPLYSATSSSIASASTVDLSTATGNVVHITGSSTITSFGTVPAGATFTLIFDATPILTYNATSLILNTGTSNYTVTAKDIATAVSLGGGNWSLSLQRTPATRLPNASVTTLEALVSGGGIAAPATLDSNSAVYNNATLFLAAASTLTVAAGALAVLGGGVTILVGQSGTATLAFSGGATKENASGTSASSVTLSASGIYALLPSSSGSDKWRLTGGASI